MATFIGGFGSALKSTSSPTVAYPANVAVGDLIVLYVGSDATSSSLNGAYVTDGATSNIFTTTSFSSPIVSESGTTVKMYEVYSVATVAKTTADSITVAGFTGQTQTIFSGGIYRPATNEYFPQSINPSSFPPSSLATAVSGTTTAAVTITGTGTSPGIVFGALLTQATSTDTFTADADTTNGTWSTVLAGTQNGTGSSTTNTIRISTSGASAATNNTIVFQHKILTATGSQTYNPTLVTARPFGMVLREFPIYTAVQIAAEGTSGGSGAGFITTYNTNPISSLATSGTSVSNNMNKYNVNPISSILTSGSSGKTNETFFYSMSSEGTITASGKFGESFKYAISPSSTATSSAKLNTDPLGTLTSQFIGWGIPL